MNATNRVEDDKLQLCDKNSSDPHNIQMWGGGGKIALNRRFFYDENGFIHCWVVKVAEMTLFWPRMRLWFSPLEVTVLWLKWLLSVSTKVQSIDNEEVHIWLTSEVHIWLTCVLDNGIWSKNWFRNLFVGTHRSTTGGRVWSEFFSMNHVRDYTLTVVYMSNMSDTIDNIKLQVTSDTLRVVFTIWLEFKMSSSCQCGHIRSSIFADTIRSWVMTHLT